MDHQALSDRIRAEGVRLGLDAVGIIPARPSEGAEAYRNWLDQGFAGEMGYMARYEDQRANPARLLEGAESLIVALQNYNPPEDRAEAAKGPTGRIARYARGDDYHNILHDRLKALLAFLRKEAGQTVTGRVFVDTGPVLEREAARRAGLGNFGKNTNLLRKGPGSYFFIGEILVDIELTYDSPAIRDMCGHCTRCLDACPTQAFPAPYVLDARRCISYMTIELKGDMPEALRPQAGDWIFGCDICQEVCPYNRQAPASQEAAYRPRPGLSAPSLLELLGGTQEDFSRRFRNSPVKRAKRKGLLRNVAVALGNAKDPVALPALCEALRDPEPMVRRHVAWALGRIGGPETEAALREAASAESDASVLEAIRKELP
ncbi:MAG: tRNA epoxyqueuosine(34) reductase QueG [Armatimonadetes bacterium]|nr:tRNA epoxyqueuosine(34) reductase QueG [Armatimonadota bacterium]